MQIVLSLLAVLVVGPFKPDLTLTPGIVRSVTIEQVCLTRWRRDRRYVSEGMKIDVARRYHVEWPPLRKGHRLTAPQRAQRAKWEVDHLIPRELGGADVVENLWMQPIDNAHKKDVLENRLRRAVCAGTMTLDDARAQMRAWGR